MAARTGADAVLNSNDPAEKEFRALMQKDDEAQEEVDQWIKENDEFAAKGAAASRAELKARILKRMEPVEKGYQDFIKAHPRHSRARVAYASFLGDIKGEEAALEQLEKALAIDTNNPAIYNNLANIYGHIGPVTNAFAYYERAIKLSPDQPVYYHNFGTTVFLFRKDAKEYYHIEEPQVFAKAFELYSNAMKLDPTSFPLASDVAQTYYGVHPFPPGEALKAWTNALRLTDDEVEKEGVYIHFARVNMLAGKYALARNHLQDVTNSKYAELKRRILRTLDEREKESAATNPASSKAQAASSSAGAK